MSIRESSRSSDGRHSATELPSRGSLPPRSSRVGLDSKGIGRQSVEGSVSSRRVSTTDSSGRGSDEGSGHGTPHGRRAFRLDNTNQPPLSAAIPRRVEPWYKATSRNIVEHRCTVVFTMGMTIYALLAGDLRLAVTDATADPFFEAMVLVCIIVFGLETILSMLGKADYICSFFFWLDVISTLSLVLDIEVIADQLAAASNGNGDASSAGSARGGRAARIGAKAGRVVRVLRLVRILKLYKAYYEAQAAKRRKARKGPDDEEEWDEEDLKGQDDGNDLEGQESNVGKKLSEMTTRRVICLILAMLFGLPIFQTDTADQAARSAHYGAEHVMRKLTLLVQGAGNSSAAALRKEYEVALLHFIYYHNWFAKADDSFCPSRSCAGQYYAQLFWVGIASTSTSVLQATSQLAPVTDTDIAKWEAGHQQGPTTIYGYGTLPPEARAMISRNWTVACNWDEYQALGFSFLSQNIRGVVSYLAPCPEKLRVQERLMIVPRLVTPAQLKGWHLTFFFDLRPFSRQDSMYSLLNTGSILVLLVMASLMFSNDANRLIVHPVERMVKRVNAIRDNPLMAMEMADEEFKLELVAKARRARARKEPIKNLLKEALTGQCCAGQEQPMETVILEKTIIKLGSLLALGFGEAGANIIGHNMKGGDSAGIEIMIPGTRVEAVIGVVRVRDFSTATEVLQAKILTFVNQIAEIVHGVVQEFKGAPNRNSGEYFLVFWRIAAPQWDQTEEEAAQREREASKVAEMSIVAFSKILGALHKSPLLAAYRGHPGLQYRLRERCRVNLSFGLHAGWAIEGAVGSEFKVDASYLSPHVSIATSIEQSTQIYGVSLIVSQSVVEWCSAKLVSKCRLIDRVVIRGSTQPTELYCVDLDFLAVVVGKEEPLQIVWNTRNRFKVRQFLDAEKANMNSDSLDLGVVFDADPNIRDMRRRYTVEFFQLFGMGYQNYAQGEWQVARRMLSCTRAILGSEDGPSSALLRYMEVPHRFEAPKDWLGIRDLPTTGPGGFG